MERSVSRGNRAALRERKNWQGEELWEGEKSSMQGVVCDSS